MTSDRSVLDRQMERVELRPFTLERFHRRRQRKDRNRRIGAAVVGVAVAVAGIGGLLRSFSSGGPTSPAAPSEPTASPSIQAFTREQLAGVWLQTRGATPAPHKVLTFTTAGTFGIEAADRDAYGAVDGTYQVQGYTITFIDPDRECPLMEWTGVSPGGGAPARGVVPAQFTITDTGAGDCTAPSGFDIEGTRLAFVRVSPRTAETDSWEMESEFESGRQPDEAAPTLQRVAGIWFQDDGEHVLRISPGGEYTIGVGEAFVTDPADTGTISIGDEGTIEFTSGPESRTCPEGTVLTWRNVRVDGAGMFVNSANDQVEGDPCASLPIRPVSWHKLIGY